MAWAANSPITCEMGKGMGWGGGEHLGIWAQLDSYTGMSGLRVSCRVRFVLCPPWNCPCLKPQSIQDLNHPQCSVTLVLCWIS